MSHYCLYYCYCCERTTTEEGGFESETRFVVVLCAIRRCLKNDKNKNVLQFSFQYLFYTSWKRIDQSKEHFLW